ncbi:hypothetical protein L9F63_008549, partial [Diploptera punctata]
QSSCHVKSESCFAYLHAIFQFTPPMLLTPYDNTGVTISYVSDSRHISGSSPDISGYVAVFPPDVSPSTA